LNSVIISLSYFNNYFLIEFLEIIMKKIIAAIALVAFASSASAFFGGDDNQSGYGTGSADGAFDGRGPISPLPGSSPNASVKDSAPLSLPRPERSRNSFISG
jgi:hypothetical protein